MTNARQHNERKGRHAENWAMLYLRLKGYRILAKRRKTPVGEIDLIACHGNALVFIEVKARRTRSAGLESITKRQERRIIRAALYELKNFKREKTDTIRFDVIIITPWPWPYHIKNAFSES